MAKRSTLALIALILAIVALIAWVLPFAGSDSILYSERISGFGLISMAFEDFVEEGITIVFSAVFAVAAIVFSILTMSNPKFAIGVHIAGCLSAVMLLVSMASLQVLDLAGAGFWIFFIAELAAAVLSGWALRGPAAGHVPSAEHIDLCPKCGKKVSNTARFCPGCGAKLSTIEGVPAPPEPAPQPAPASESGRVISSIPVKKEPVPQPEPAPASEPGRVISSIPVRKDTASQPEPAPASGPGRVISSILLKKEPDTQPESAPASEPARVVSTVPVKTESASDAVVPGEWHSAGDDDL